MRSYHHKLRLKQIHYDTASQLHWIHQPFDGQHAPPWFKRTATQRLRRLAKEAGINNKGLSPKEIYLESIRAIVRATGADNSRAADQVQEVAQKWDVVLSEYMAEQRKQSKPTTSAARKESFTAAFDWPHFGIHCGDQLICDTTAPVEIGGLVLYKSKTSDETYFARVCMVTDETVRLTGEFTQADDYPLSAIVSVCTDVVHGEDCRQNKIDSLRARLGKLESSDDITDHSNRFKLEREIYDLEHMPEDDPLPEADEWPDVIAA